MRGKKTDPVFMSEFIRHCVAGLGMEKSEDILCHAKSIIQEIDEEIRRVEERKVMRSKLLDVVAAFEISSKDKSQEAKLLDFAKLQYPTTCKEICDLLKEDKSLPVSSMQSFGEGTVVWNFCIKQLIEAKILERMEDGFRCGERFGEYMTFAGVA
jgi:hypothetical protein